MSGFRRISTKRAAWLASTALAATLAGTAAAQAADSTWSTSPGTGDFNTAANWSPAVVPTGTAFFGTSSTTAVSFSADASFGGWTFNSGASTYHFTNSRSLSFIDAGINAQGGQAFIRNDTNALNFYNSSTAGAGVAPATQFDIQNGGSVNFYDTSTAGNSRISLGGGGAANRIYFNNSSTAGNAQINAFSGSPAVVFKDTSSAGTARILVNSTATFSNASSAGSAAFNGSGVLQFFNNSTASSADVTLQLVQFFDTSSGGNATLRTFAGGVVDFSTLTSAGTTAGSISGTGTFNFGTKTITVGGNNQSTTVAGTIEGIGGALVKTGTGMLTLSGTNTYAGGTTISAGTLQIGDGGTTGSVLGNITNNAALIFNRSDAVTFGNAIGGSGLVSKQGTGTLTLSGTNTYTGGTTVNAGVLVVNGSIASSVLTAVSSGATLSGIGTAGNTVINSGGTLAAGDGFAGTSLNVTGSLAFQSGAIYMVQINPATSSFTEVTGTATLGGTTVKAIYANGSYVAKQYTIVTAGSVSGTFGSVVDTNLPTNFHTTLSYDPTHAYLNLVLNFVPPGGGLRGNQNGVGNAIVGYFNTNGGIPLVYSGLTPAGLTQASGETATGSQQTTFNAMTQFMSIMTDPFTPGRGDGVHAPAYAEDNVAANAYASSGKPRSKNERDAYAAIYSKAPLRSNYDPRWSVWAAGFGGAQTTDGNLAAGSNTSTSRIFGMAAGADYILSPNTVAGFALAGGGTSFSVVNGGSGRSDLFQAGAFVRHTIGAAYVSGALAYGWQDVTTDRTVTIAGVDRLRAQFNANAYSGRLEGGYRIVTPWIGGIGLTPYAAGQFTTFDLPAYAESVVSGTNTFALAYGSKSVTDSRSELGIRADKSWAMPNAILTLRGRAAWAHDFNPDHAINSAFQALPGASFTVNGARQASESALTTASLQMKWMNGWSAAGTFEGEFSDVTRSYAGKGVVRYAW